MEIYNDNDDFMDELAEFEDFFNYQKEEQDKDEEELWIEFEIENIEYPTHNVEFHTYCRLGTLSYPYKYNQQLEIDSCLN